MNTLKTTVLLLVLAALTALTGCTASKTAPAKGMSLMERFHSGKDLIHDSEEDKLSSDSEKARKFLTRGVSFVRQGREELAFEQFSRAAALDPQLMEARFNRGKLLVARGMTDQALNEFQTVIEHMPEFAPAYEAAGIVYFQNSLYEEAKRHFAKALGLDPALTRSYTHMGAIHNYNKNYDQALKAFKTAASTDPADGSIYNNIGITHSMMGDDQAAVEAFRVAIRLGAPSSRAYNNMGLALARLKRFDEALEAFRCAKGEAAAYNNLGYVFFLNGDYTRAVACFERAMEIEPTYYHRASENLKRARLALRFEQGNGKPVIPSSGIIPEVDDTPRLPASKTGPLSETRKGPGPRLHKSAPKPHSMNRVSPASLRSTPRLASTPARTTQTVKVTTASTARRIRLSPPATQSATTAIRTKAQRAPVPKYTLHVSSWRTQEKAQEQAALLTQQGFSADVIHVTLPEKGEWYRVTIGAYRNLGQARAERARMRNVQRFKGVRVVNRTRHTYRAHS